MEVYAIFMVYPDHIYTILPPFLDYNTCHAFVKAFLDAHVLNDVTGAYCVPPEYLESIGILRNG